MKIENWIAGQFQPAQSGESFQVKRSIPSTEGYEVSSSSAMDVILAIQSCKKAELKWSKSTYEKRGVLLARIGEIIRERAEPWAEAEAAATGLPIDLLLNQSYFYGAQVFENGAQSAARFAESSSLVRGPVGTCALFLPWVLSFRIFAERCMPALLHGNTLIIKASEKNPLVGRFISECLAEVLADPVVALLQGQGSEVGPTLSAHPAIAAVDFVGRYETAENLLSQASRLGKRLRLLAGAKNSAVVFDDCDFGEVIPELLRCAFTGQGQLAQNISRVFVSSKRHAEFIECIKASLEDSALISGYSRPLINKEAEESFQKSLEEIRDEGGKVLELPTKASPRPHLIHDLTMCSPYQQSEVYGPLLLIGEYKYLHEAEKWVNTGFHGHSAQVWTKDLGRAHKFAAKLQVGTVWVNQWFDQAIEAPFVQRSSGYNAYSPGGSDEFYSTFTRILG